MLKRRIRVVSIVAGLAMITGAHVAVSAGRRGLDSLVSVNFRNATIEHIARIIVQQAGLRYEYRASRRNLGSLQYIRTTVRFKRVPAGEALVRTLLPYGVGYNVNANRVTLFVIDRNKFRRFLENLEKRLEERRAKAKARRRPRKARGGKKTGVAKQLPRATDSDIRKLLDESAMRRRQKIFYVLTGLIDAGAAQLCEADLKDVRWKDFAHESFLAQQKVRDMYDIPEEVLSRTIDEGIIYCWPTPIPPASCHVPFKHWTIMALRDYSIGAIHRYVIMLDLHGKPPEAEREKIVRAIVEEGKKYGHPAALVVELYSSAEAPDWITRAIYAPDGDWVLADSAPDPDYTGYKLKIRHAVFEVKTVGEEKKPK